MADKKLTPFAAAGLVDAYVRKLGLVPGMTAEDRRVVVRIRVALAGVRLRYLSEQTFCALPAEVARCLSGPCVDVPTLKVARAEGGRHG